MAAQEPRQTPGAERPHQHDGQHQQGKNGTPEPPKNSPNIWIQMAIALAIFVVVSAGYSLYRDYLANQNPTVPLSQIVNDIENGKITSVTISGDQITATYADKTHKVSQKESENSFTQTLANYGATPGEIDSVKILVEDQSGLRFWFLTLAPLLIPALMIIGLIWYLTRQLKGGGMQAFTFGKSMARLVRPEDTVQRVTFADVAGAKEAKEELSEIVDFLKNPKKFIQIGARIPKGVLLMGAPGAGKTLLARAVAGESGVPFFSISGSEFVEMFVGVGASRSARSFRDGEKDCPRNYLR